MELEKYISPSTKGVALIVTNSYDEQRGRELPGTYQDGKKFRQFLLECNYAAIWYHDVTKNDFTDYCNKLVNYKKYPKTCRRLVVVFSGHGSENILEFQDGGKVEIDKMKKWFRPADAKNDALGNMVRMFFIDACRGSKKDPGYPCKTTISPTNHLHIKKHPNDVDVLVAYSSISEHKSKELVGGLGGIWMTNLLKELNKNPYRDIESILKRVNKIMKSNTTDEGCYQIGEYTSTLSEKVCFKVLSEEFAKEAAKETVKEATKVGCTQVSKEIVRSVTNGTAKEAAKEFMNNGIKEAVVQAATATAKETAKQAVKQTVIAAVPIGLAVEGACLAYGIKSAHNKKKRGEISKTKYHDICVEQTTTSGGSAAGGIGGSVGGAVIGATVGSVIPVAGTAIGGIFGGIIGGIFGGLGGSLVGKGVGKGINFARHY